MATAPPEHGVRLLLTTAVGFVLEHHPAAARAVLNSALADFPIIGDQLRESVHPLRGSGFGLAIGFTGLLWGSLGVTQVAQHAMAQIWNVPGVERPGLPARLLRGLSLFVLIGLGVVASTLLSLPPSSTWSKRRGCGPGASSSRRLSKPTAGPSISLPGKRNVARNSRSRPPGPVQEIQQNGNVGEVVGGGEVPMPREALLARTLVELADTLVDDFDVVELLTLLTDRCVEVLDVAAAGLMLAAPEGDLRVMASSSEEMRLVELFELQSSEGPCPDCYRTGEPSLNPNLAAENGRWPRFAPVALEAGFRSVHALPMRLRGLVIGALNLFRTEEGLLDEADVVVAQALADVATIAILQHRAALQDHIVADQLNHALNSRVLIEQAKGVIAERAHLDMDQAFSCLRHHARAHNLLLVDVAQSVIDGKVTPESPRLTARP